VKSQASPKHLSLKLACNPKINGEVAILKNSNKKETKKSKKFSLKHFLKKRAVILIPVKQEIKI
jgi:hypothetical protein